jgi:aspartyl aminopeptidase
VGMPMLSMHSIREQAGTADAAQMIAVLKHVFERG